MKFKIDKKYKESLKLYGIDLDDLSHPLSKEIDLISKQKNDLLFKSIEHLIFLFLIDIYTIKNYNFIDFQYFLSKIKKNDISFWGERFEVFFYRLLLEKLKESSTFKIKRGKEGIEADYIIYNDNKIIAIETTTLRFSEDSLMKNPIGKIKSKISEKEKKNYVGINCCLVVDITNLFFYRKLYNNFSLTISDLFKSFESNFGAIYLCQSIHYQENEKLNYKFQIYDWYNPNISLDLESFLKNTMIIDDDSDSDNRILLRI